MVHSLNRFPRWTYRVLADENRHSEWHRRGEMTWTGLRPARPAALSTDRVPAAVLALAGILTAQLGAAAATPLFTELTPLGTAWLRTTWAALIMIVFVRPRFWRYPRRDLQLVVLLGIVNAVMIMGFYQAIDRIPLGTAVAIGSLGSLGVAVAKARNWLGLLWPVIAMVGVVCLTRPWTGSVDAVGVGFAALDGSAWAAYILLSQHLGHRFTGYDGLSITIVVASAMAALFGAHHAIGHLTLAVVLLGSVVALLSPVCTFTFELAALRRLSAATFGIFMCLEPAVGLLVGTVFLHQVPGALQGLGILLVILAALGAERHGRAGVSAFVPIDN